MTENVQTIPSALSAAVAAEVAHYGTRNQETGGFFIAPRGSTTLTGFAMAGTRGIVRRPDLFQISERSLNLIFDYVDDHDLWLPCHAHSHRFEAFMSLTDASHGINVEGFTCTIIPNFEYPSANAVDWNWWKFTNGTWCSVTPPTAHDGEITELLVFDEDGVRGR